MPDIRSDPVSLDKSGLSNPLAGVVVVAVAVAVEKNLAHTQDQTDTRPLQASVTAVLARPRSCRAQAWQMSNETSSSVMDNVRLAAAEAVVAGHKLCSLVDTTLQMGSSVDSKVSVEVGYQSMEEEYNSQDSSTLVSDTYSTYCSAMDLMSAKASKSGLPEAVPSSLSVQVSEKVGSK